ncbi:MAG: hypothetical protein CL609_20225 [Anaerolineaceae bacterium]|nr:hypothetical protein [Anaerolineaceae bacterium]
MKILILSTWFPYPLNQGSKIRAFFLIKALAENHEITLISFEDAPIQPEWKEEIHKYCKEIIIFPKQPFAYQKTKLLLGFFSTKPSTVFAGYSKDFEALVLQTAKQRNPDLIFAFTFVTAPYALKTDIPLKVVDADNLLAFMLYENYQLAQGLLQKLRRYMAYIKFKNYESNIYRHFDRCLVVSEKDVDRIKTYIPFTDQQVLNVPNGVNTQTHKPGTIAKQKKQIIYNGAMTYYPNYDAMFFFLKDIFPRILHQLPGTQLNITGKTQGVPIENLPMTKNVRLTGYLPDIRPIVSSSSVCIVPLRQGAGTRLKILEAMALGTAVVSTTKGAEGLSVENGIHLLIADTPEKFAKAVIQLMEDEELNQKIVQNALSLVQNIYNWDQIGANFAQQISNLSNIKNHA